MTKIVFVAVFIAVFYVAWQAVARTAGRQRAAFARSRPHGRAFACLLLDPLWGGG